MKKVIRAKTLQILDKKIYSEDLLSGWVVKTPAKKCWSLFRGTYWKVVLEK